MSQVQVTLSFASVEDAVVGLGKLAGLPAAVAVAVVPAQPDKVRQGRSDAGKTRGPHNKGNGQAPAGTVTGITDPSNAGQQAATLTSTTPVPVPAKPAAPEKEANPPTQSTAPANVAGNAPAAAVPPVADVQKAVERMFNAKGYEDCALLLSRFGVKRWSELPDDQRANFIRRADGVIAGEAI